LEASSNGFEPGENPAVVELHAWNIMGGRIDWAAVPVLAEAYGIEDLELFIDLLGTIQEHVAKRNG